MKEELLMTGAVEPTNEPFAVAKLAGIQMCQAYRRQYGSDFISVIPANTYGPNDHTGKDAHVVSSLMARLHEAKLNDAKEVVVWGSGKPKREFLYVDDLADACLFLMKNYDSGEVINVGLGKETSIRELAEMLKKIAGYKGQIIYDTTKPDGNLRRFLDSGKMRSLGWKPKTALIKGLQQTYRAFQNNDANVA